MTDRIHEILLGREYGDATKQLTDLVMACEKAVEDYGKKSFFGKDKGKEAHDKFAAALIQAIRALERGGKIRNARDAEECFSAVDRAMSMVRLAYPNWPRAYGYWDVFLTGK